MILKWLIEEAYWCAYYANQRKNKDIPFIAGIIFVIVMFYVNILTLLITIELFMEYHILYLLPKDYRLAVYIYSVILIPVCILVKITYKRQGKKKILAYFEKMPARRQRMGKACFIIYGVGSIVIAYTVLYFFLEAKKIPVDEDKQHQEYLESLWADPCTKDSGKVDTVEQFDIIKQ